MNIEGTKHEKAVLVVMAYIIGFTSGFIAFGISGGMSAKEYKMDSNMPTMEFPPMGEYTPPTENPPMDTTIPADADDITMPAGEVVSYEDGKLYAMVGDERFVLSISNSIMPRENVEGFSTQGIHENLPAYVASADSNYVYFCEQQGSTPECTHFVFDVTSNIIQFVSVDGEKLVTDNSVATEATWGTTGLTVAGYTSIDPTMPWKLAPTE